MTCASSFIISLSRNRSTLTGWAAQAHMPQAWGSSAAAAANSGLSEVLPCRPMAHKHIPLVASPAETEASRETKERTCSRCMRVLTPGYFCLFLSPIFLFFRKRTLSLLGWSVIVLRTSSFYGQQKHFGASLFSARCAGLGL